jgi:hypothetical protein
MKTYLWAALAATLMAAPASAGPIERACLQSSRTAANGAVCACIQTVADQTLRGQDQRKAAKLITNPDAAHEVWLSKRPGDDAFWERYKNFGATAEAYCAA